MVSGDRKRQSREEDTTDEPPFRYSKTFNVGRASVETKVHEATSEEDDAAVSSFVDMLLTSSEVGREFAKKSLSIRNANRSAEDEIAIEM